jgi:hypothetical protein
MSTPQFLDHELFALLREDRVDEFNARVEAGEKPPSLVGANLRGCDLRGLNAAGMDLRNAYLRGADLRGLDLRTTQLGGASIRKTQLSGTFFPSDLSPQEILMSLELGTRLRLNT